ncbi:MAG: hypothetical protein IJ761_02855 [Bacteroidales bacterium]|nr:hypothetical protein [Bacteroidales bacterium]
MEQDYDIYETTPVEQTADTEQPSEQVLRNIMIFASCFQTINVDGVNISISLN